MTNHGYVDRSGVTTLKSALGSATTPAPSSPPLVSFAGGNLPSKYSIGGADTRVPNTLAPSLAIGKHGFREVDNSISRKGVYFGNQANLQLGRFDRLVNVTSKHNNKFGDTASAEERVLLYDEAKNTNPEFSAGKRWLAVTIAELIFIFPALPNGTHPELADFETRIGGTLFAVAY